MSEFITVNNRERKKNLAVTFKKVTSLNIRLFYEKYHTYLVLSNNLELLLGSQVYTT